MPRDSDSIKIRKWAETGDRIDPDDASLDPRLSRGIGWPSSFSQSGGDVPRREVMNQLFAELSGMLAEINVNGILEYSNLIDYQQFAFVNEEGRLYYARRNNGPSFNNVGGPPGSDDDENDNWRLMLADVEDDPITLTVTISGPTTRTRGQAAEYTLALGGSATGGATYQWQSSLNGSSWANISGATGTTLSFAAPNIVQAATRFIRCLVTRQAVMSTSNIIRTEWPAATVSVTIGGQTERTPGQTATYTSQVTGSAGGSITYQWQNSNDNTNWTDISGATSASYTRPAPPQDQATTRYTRLQVERSGISATSNVIRTDWLAAQVTVMISGPTSRTARQTATYTSSVGGSATGNVTYQWQTSSDNSSWSNVSGATNASYTRAAPPQSQTLRLFVRLRATRAGITVTSNVIRTDWSAAAVVASASGPSARNHGQNATYTSQVTGSATGSISYQWLG